MKKLTVKPQLAFGEAVKLAFSRIMQTSGRSRRSEFWWFMLVYIIVYWILSTIATLLFPPLGAQIAVGIIMLIALPITVRRLHDTGHGAWWVVVSWLFNVALSIYMVTSGYIEEITSVNADPIRAFESLNIPLFGTASLVVVFTSLATFIFCLLDSKPQANKYGESPKYVVVSDEEETRPEEAVNTFNS
jgi:uncharacterized membrane protein YhaH (DUF805 family)